jgi:hypothetical protein
MIAKRKKVYKSKPKNLSEESPLFGHYVIWKIKSVLGRLVVSD